jgi:hypothetical protein
MCPVTLQVATAVLHMERIDAAAAANTAAGGWGIPGRYGEGVREELELSDEAVEQLTDQLAALGKQHKELLHKFTALLPAQVSVGVGGLRGARLWCCCVCNPWVQGWLQKGQLQEGGGVC